MSHYFDPVPAAPSRRGPVTLKLPDFQAELEVDRGVFSATGVDPGTLELLRSGVGAPAGGSDLLDLGCGYGPIAVTLAHRFPDAKVWAVDINSRARELTADNSAALGLGPRVRAVAPEDVPADIRFGGIWSNPPIRIGKAALHDLLLRWLPRLAPEAGAWMVVQRHLGADSLSAWLGHEGWEVRRLASKKGYRILSVRRGPG